MIPSRNPNADKTTYDKRLEQFRNLTQRADGKINYHFETEILPTLMTKIPMKKMSIEEYNIMKAKTIKLCTQLADNAYSAKEISLEEYNIMKAENIKLADNAYSAKEISLEEYNIIKADIETSKNKTYQ
jgi:hypothetical protein